MSDDDPDKVRADFDDAVNMTPKELEDWLETDESRSVGHESGRRVVAIKRTKKDELSDDDLAHMKKVVGYVNRHLAQGGPKEDKERSRWRCSLMNWGHDPLKG